MKHKLAVILTACFVTMGLLLGTSAAQEATVIFDPDDSTKAIRIENLDIDGTTYNVNFTAIITAEQVYGTFPGTFDFDTSQAANAAIDAVLSELDNFGAMAVGAEGSVASPALGLGFDSERVLDLKIKAVLAVEIVYIDGEWNKLSAPPGSIEFYNSYNSVWAGFTKVSEPPVTIGGTVTGLEGNGLVLQNNGGDDLPIDTDGPFTFDTSLEPGLNYNVTVLTNPANPVQECVVENGSGIVPSENVTDVDVICAEPILVDNLDKVAAEGDILPDNTVLTTILLDGGVAINFKGQVAFGGKDGDGRDAAFTQAGLVVAEGVTLPDDTTLAAFRGQGQVAISAGLSGDRVAFHGLAETGENDTAAVFTQAGQVAAVGDPADTVNIYTVSDIDPQGKVAINNVDEVAFHGKANCGQLCEVSAVYISDGLATQWAALAPSVLPDETPLGDITDSGGVAINDASVVAFHGRVFDIPAVFTQNGLVAKVGTGLGDGTFLEDINEDGGVAINLFDQVAFHGQQDDGDKVVLISDGETTRVVARVGDTLLDGTPLEDIEVSGGVAINLFGDVAFHGRTGGLRAVFTQNGLVAREASNLPDGTTLDEINDNAGVAINPYGFDVAFHGRIGTTDAVFVGQVPEEFDMMPQEFDHGAAMFME